MFPLQHNCTEHVQQKLKKNFTVQFSPHILLPAHLSRNLCTDTPINCVPITYTYTKFLGSRVRADNRLIICQDNCPYRPLLSRQRHTRAPARADHAYLCAAHGANVQSTTVHCPRELRGEMSGLPVLLLLLGAGLWGCEAFTAQQRVYPGQNELFELSIVHLNDFHARYVFTLKIRLVVD